VIPVKIEIEIVISKKGKIKAILDDRNSETAQSFFENLPMEGPTQLWYE